MKFEFINSEISSIKADLLVVLVVDKNMNHKFIQHKKEFEFFGYKGEDVLLLSEQKTLYVGTPNLEYDTLRKTSAKIYNAVKNLNITSIKMALYAKHCLKISTQSLVEGFELISHPFEKYKSDKKDVKFQKVIFGAQEYSGRPFKEDKINEGIRNGIIMANATNFTKDIVNETPEIYTPLKMAQDAQNLAEICDNVECKIYDEKFLQKEKMNAFLAVNKSSAHPARLIHLIYKPENSLKRVIFVGKGLTYDSGGLSLKPANYMLTMKSDKSGAAAALGIIKGASELNLPFEIHAILGATENMIGSNSYKPDDILLSRAGVSIEVQNTDAEGRLVLADCLSWAQEFKPDLLIDMATLTGACIVGLGEYTSGILGNSAELKAKFKELIAKSGEMATILDFNEYLQDEIKSQIADVSNCAKGRYGGSITAGMFLDKFIQPEFKDKWLHLDIAGPAYVQKEWGYNTFGASGAGVRMNLYFLCELAKVGLSC